MEKYVILRAYAELNDFLPKKKRGRELQVAFFGNPAVKDIIESAGIPHTEVDLILANSHPVNFNYHIQHGDRISVYPEFELIDIGPVNALRPIPLRKPSFVADSHLGKLTRLLRMLGIDVMYRSDIHDEEIIRASINEKRTILTRDLGILKNGKVSRGYFIRSQNPSDQCREVIRKFSMEQIISPFSRCLECNGQFHEIDKTEYKEQIPERAFDTFNEFYRCSGCQKIYWKGSHYERMLRMIDQLRFN